MRDDSMSGGRSTTGEQAGKEAERGPDGESATARALIELAETFARVGEVLTAIGMPASGRECADQVEPTRHEAERIARLWSYLDGRASGGPDLRRAAAELAAMGPSDPRD